MESGLVRNYSLLVLCKDGDVIAQQAALPSLHA